jgi:hypothetical protein
MFEKFDIALLTCLPERKSNGKKRKENSLKKLKKEKEKRELSMDYGS